MAIKLDRNRSYYLFTIESDDPVFIGVYLFGELNVDWDEVTVMEVPGDGVYQFELGSETIHSESDAIYTIGVAVGRAQQAMGE